MPTLISYYQEIKDQLRTQLEASETTEQIVNILQDEVNKLADLNGDYIRGLTPPHARIAMFMLNQLNQYTSTLSLIQLQDSTPNSDKGSTLAVQPLNILVQKIASTNYFQPMFSQLVQQNRNVINISAGFIIGMAGMAEGSLLGLIVAIITAGVIGKTLQPKNLPENKDFPSLPEPPKNQVKIGIDIHRLLNYLYQALQSIDNIVDAYREREEKVPLSVPVPGLENHPDVLEFLQDLMADALNEQTQLAASVRRHIKQAETILKHYGIQALVYQPAMEGKLMFDFERCLDTKISDYVTLKHAFVKGDQVLLSGRVIKPASS